MQDNCVAFKDVLLYIIDNRSPSRASYRRSEVTSRSSSENQQVHDRT